MPALATKNLTKHFDGVLAIDRLSVAFEAGQITGIIGPNGSGKSTLVNLLTGMLPFDSGTIISSGERLKRVVPADLPARGVTRTFQEVRLFEQMTVEDNILLTLTERSVAGALLERASTAHAMRAKELLQLVNLWDKRHQLASQLSYGMRKLLEVARVLAMEPKVALFDEPFAGLFPKMITIVMAQLHSLRAHGVAVVLIEHNMELIRRLSDRVIVMDSGVILADGVPSKVLKQKNVIQAYLGD